MSKPIFTNQGDDRQCSAPHQAAGSGHRDLGRTSKAAETGRVTMVSPSAIGAVAARPRRAGNGMGDGGDGGRGRDGVRAGTQAAYLSLSLLLYLSLSLSILAVPPKSATRTLGKTTPAAAAQISSGVRAAVVVGVGGGGDRAKPFAGWEAWVWVRRIMPSACAWPPWPRLGQGIRGIGGAERRGDAPATAGAADKLGCICQSLPLFPHLRRNAVRAY